MPTILMQGNALWVRMLLMGSQWWQVLIYEQDQGIITITPQRKPGGRALGKKLIPATQDQQIQ